MPDITLNPRSPQSRRYYFKVIVPAWMEKFGVSKEQANEDIKFVFNGSKSYEDTTGEKFWSDMEELREIFLHRYGILIDLPSEQFE